MCLYVLSSASLSQYHSRHIISVSRCKCKYFLLCIWYGGVYFSWNVYCWSHGMYGWMWTLACTVCYVKPRLFLLHEKDVFTVSLFEQLVQHVFWNRGISLHVMNSCSSLYSMLYNIFFLKVVSQVRPAAYTMYNSLNWISFKRTDDRDTIYDGCNMIKGTHWVWSSNLGYVI